MIITYTPRFYNPTKIFRVMYETQERKLAFNAKSLEEWAKWREELRRKLVELLGGFPEEKTPLSPETLEQKEYPLWIREKVIYQSTPYSTVLAWILIPKRGRPPFPAVIAIHGHGYGKDSIVGIKEDGTERSQPEGYQKDFALELAKRGFLVVAPEQACFGERREKEDSGKGPGANSCHLGTVWAFMMGKTMVGIRVWDIMRTIDYLETRPDVDPGRIGCMGISGGGTTTLFTTALDDRIRVAVVSGYLNTFKDSLLSVRHCICNFIPGILKYAEMYDVAALIAPKPLLAEAGTKDPIFPIRATLKAYQYLKKVYSLLGVPERLDIDVFEGGHEISGRKAYDWLSKWLSIKDPDELLKPKA